MWYALIADEQVGPLDLPGLMALRQSGRIQDTTYVWREGMGEWLPLSDVPELASLLEPGESADVEDLDESEVEAADEGATLMMDGDQGKDWASDLESLAQQSTPVAGPGAASGRNRGGAPPRPAAILPAPPSPMPEPLEGFDLPAESVEAELPDQSVEIPDVALVPTVGMPGLTDADVPGARPLTAERPFSMPPALAAPQEVDFGSLLEPDTAALDAEGAPPVPAPAPPAPTGRRLGVWLVLLPILGATAAAVVLWVRHQQAVALRAIPTPAPVTEASEPVPATTAPPPIATTAPPAPTTPPTTPSTPPSAVAGTALPSAVGTAPPSAVAGTAPPSAVAGTAPPTAAPAEPTRPPARPSAGPRPPPPPTSPPSEARTLSRAEINAVVNGSMSSIRACGAQQPDLKGMFSVSTTIVRDGSVSSAQVITARFRDSPARPCLEQKIRALKFPKFGGDPIQFNLPLEL